MVYQGIFPADQVNAEINSSGFDVKRAMRVTQGQITEMIAEMADPNVTVMTIDGHSFDKIKDATALQLAVTDKLSRLEDQSTTIMAVFSELYKMEKTLTA